MPLRHYGHYGITGTPYQFPNASAAPARGFRPRLAGRTRHYGDAISIPQCVSRSRPRLPASLGGAHPALRGRHINSQCVSRSRPRLPASLGGAHPAAQLRFDERKKAIVAERPAGRRSRFEPGARCGFLGPRFEQVGEARNAVQQRRNRASASSRPARCAGTLDARQSAALSTSPALTGFSAR